MKTKAILFALVLFVALLLAGCTGGRVGAMQTESRSVELGNAESVQVDVTFGAGDLLVSGGAQELLEADFTYNVARLKPEVKYSGDRLTLRQPESRGLPFLGDIEDFHNKWDLRFFDGMPMDLKFDVGGGTSDLKLSGLSLTGLQVNLGAGESTIDLSGDWAQDLDVKIDAGAADITVMLPEQVGVRVEVEAAISSVDAYDMTQDGHIYTNAAYGEAEVTLNVNVEAGIGLIDLIVEEATTASE